MDDDTSDEVIRKRREGHGAMMLVGLLMTLLVIGVAFVALVNAPVFRVTAPQKSPIETQNPNAE